jgi:hypothetical protein
MRPWQRFCSTRCRTAHRNKEVRHRYVAPTALSVVDAAMEWFLADGVFHRELNLRQCCKAHQKHTHEGSEP